MSKTREVLMMRVGKGVLMPADGFTSQRLRAKGYRMNDLVGVEIRKLRNPGFHRLAHALGTLLVEHTESFENVNAHQALKRIQYEGGIACDEVGVMLGNEMGVARFPRSLSYESMDDGEFHEVYKQMCAYIARKYFPTLTEHEVARMAELMPEAA